MPPRRTLKPVQVSADPAGGRWLERFVDHARGELSLADNSVAAYRRDLKRFYLWLGNRNVAQLTIQDLADYAAWLHSRELAPASIARHVASLRVFFRFLQLEGVLKENVAELLGSPKLWERVPHAISPAAVARLMETPIRADGLWRRDRALLELLYATGCRASEVSNLELADIASGRATLPLPRQGQQAADRAARRTRPSGGNGLSRKGATTIGRRRRSAATLAVRQPPRPATRPRANLGAFQAVRDPRRNRHRPQPA